MSYQQPAPSNATSLLPSITLCAAGRPRRPRSATSSLPSSSCSSFFVIVFGPSAAARGKRQGGRKERPPARQKKRPRLPSLTLASEERRRSERPACYCPHGTDRFTLLPSSPALSFPLCVPLRGQHASKSKATERKRRYPHTASFLLRCAPRMGTSFPSLLPAVVVVGVFLLLFFVLLVFRPLLSVRLGASA